MHRSVGYPQYFYDFSTSHRVQIAMCFNDGTLEVFVFEGITKKIYASKRATKFLKKLLPLVLYLFSLLE